MQSAGQNLQGRREHLRIPHVGFDRLPLPTDLHVLERFEPCPLLRRRIALERPGLAHLELGHEDARRADSQHVRKAFVPLNLRYAASARVSNMEGSPVVLLEPLQELVRELLLGHGRRSLGFTPNATASASSVFMDGTAWPRSIWSM